MKNIIFKSRDELIQVNPEDIVYFQADGNYAIMMLASRKKQLLTMNLSKVQLTLNEQLGIQSTLFERIGRDLIIQKAYVFSIQVLHKKLILAIPNSDKHFELSASKEALKALKENQQKPLVSAQAEIQLRDLQTRKIYTLSIGQNNFGRKSATSHCEQQIDNGDNQISRQHFCIQVLCKSTDGKNEYFIRDLGSSNGTFVNGDRISTEELQAVELGAKIRAGKTDFLVELVDLDKTQMP